jgi:hypothetical protein
MIPGLLEGAVIAVGAFLAGQWLPRPRLRRDAPKPPQPVCGCTHHHSFHDPATGQCHGMVEVATHWGAYGDERKWRQDPCTCKVYSGPVPLPEYYAPEIGG